MKIRNGILNSGRAALLGGTFLVATLPTTLVFAQDANTSGNSAMAADVVMPTKAPSINAADWYWNGIFEAGGNIFIEKPPSGFGRIPTDPFWLTPKTTNSNAKMDEYGKVPRGPFLDVLGIKAGTKDGRFAVDFWADNVGYNNQRYHLSVYEPGRQYFNIGWDQIPHLLSTSAKTLFGGVGSTRLTVDTATRNFLQGQFGATFNPSQAQRTNIDRFIGGAARFGGAGFPAPMYNIDLETLRERFIAGYRNTMLDNWDFNVDYSHEHRTGTRPLGIGWGVGTGANPRPSTGSIEVPQPLDDRTQNANASGEYAGTTPWGTRWNTALKYSGSFYSNENKSIDVDNPFCRTCSAVGPWLLSEQACCATASIPTTTSTARPGALRSRYPFSRPAMSATSNTWRSGRMIRSSTTPPMASRFGLGAGQIRPYPAASLNGEVNAFLTNNVLYSRLTSDLTNTARVRYYDRRDNTPVLTFANYAYADGGVSTAQPLTRLPTSYTRLNIEDDLKWQPNRAWTFGVGYFFERYTYQNGEVDSTNEPGGKAFVNWTPYSWLTWRSSVQYSQRRYDHWLVSTPGDAGAAMRQFFVQNRNQTKANGIVEIALTKDITVSPNGGVRWIEYPTDAVIGRVQSRHQFAGNAI